MLNPLSLQKLLPLAFALLLTAVSAKERWYIAETENLLVYSNASKAQTKATIADLLNIQNTLALVLPNLSERRNKKIRVFIAKNASTIRRFSSLYNGKPKSIGGMFARDYEGDLILISSEGEFDETRSIVYHEYVHFLTTTRKFYLPPWLSEGIAETFSTIEFSKKGAKVGLAEPWRVTTLRSNKLIPFERFFHVTRSSPEYNSSNHGRGTFYAQSWALVHYFMFGQHDLPKDAFSKLVGLTSQNQFIDNSAFQEITGIDFEELGKRISRYVSRGRYHYQLYQIPELDDVSYELRTASEGEVELIHGMILLRTRSPSDAYPHIIRAYELLPESPRAAAYYGYYLYSKKLYDFAAEKFQEAIDRGSQTAADYLFSASSRIRSEHPDQQSGGSFYDKEETIKLLSYLFKARELGENRDRLYHRIGEVWIGSKVEPQEGHLGAIIEGLRLHQGDLYLQYCLAYLYHKTNQLEKAEAFVDHALSNPKIGHRRRNFENLKIRIDRKQGN
ncbi:MAG: DUF1570 domain-containing protein [Verrucomicrobiota bacterium]